MAVISNDEKSWQAQSDLHTLQQAEEIRKNRPRLNAANTEAKKQMAALNKITKSPPKPRKARGSAPKARAKGKKR